jgi:hypothetical protein
MANSTFLLLLGAIVLRGGIAFRILSLRVRISTIPAVAAKSTDQHQTLIIPQ